MILSIENTSREVATITAYGDGFVVSPPQEDDHDGIKVYTCPPCDVVSTETVTRTINVETTGSDTTGDGSVGSPFATIGKALKTIKSIMYVDITIQLGVGSFDFTLDDRNTIAFINNQRSYITIIGVIETFETIDSCVESSDESRYTITKSGRTWVEDELKELHTDNGVMPVMANSAGVDSCLVDIPRPGKVFTYFTHILTTIVNSDESKFILNYSRSGNGFLQFEDVKFDSAVGFDLRYTNANVVLKTSNLYLRNTTGTSIQKLDWGKHENSGLFVITKTAIIISSTDASDVITGESADGKFTDRTSIQFEVSVIDYNGTGLVLNFSPSIYLGVVGINYNNKTPYLGVIRCSGITEYNGELKFINTNGAVFWIRQSSKIIATIEARLYVYNCVSLFKYHTSLPKESYGHLFETGRHINIGTAKMFSNDKYQFINIEKGIRIQIDNTYPEIQQGKSETSIPVNTTTAKQVGVTEYNRSMKIVYVMTRGTILRQGFIDILNVDDTSILSDDTVTNESAAIGVTLGASIVSGVINLTFTVDNASANTVSFKYDVTRIMK